MNAESIVLTGCGWVTPLIAGNIPTVLEGYRTQVAQSAAKENFEPVAEHVLERFANLPGEAAKEDAVRIAAVALEISMRDAGLAKGSYASDRIGIVVGNALAGLNGMIDFANDVREQSPRFVSPIRFPHTVGNYVSGALARGYDIRGPASTIACGSASSLEAIREGCAMLLAGQADLVFAGGTERLTHELVDGMNHPNVCFADGACLFAMETEAGAKARGSKALAKIILVGEKQRAGPSRPEQCSIAGGSEAEAISIQAWIGRTLGADGAAAIGAAIGALRGFKVPLGGSDPLVGGKEAGIGVARTWRISTSGAALRNNDLWIEAY